MEEKRPMVSVVVLTYNHEKYIKQALDSILMQKVNFNYEILIGDDASSDNTVKILKEYQNKYPNVIKLFLNKKNLGATHNAYNLLKIARGYYLASCEGDDFWTDENKLQIQVDCLNENKEFVACAHDFEIVDENNKKYKKQYLSWIKRKTIFSIYDFDGIYLPSHPNTFLRRNLIYEGKVCLEYLIETHSMIGDRTLLLLYLLMGKFITLKKVMSSYRIVRINRNSVTSKIYSDVYKSLIDDYDITKKMESIADKYGYIIKFNAIRKIIFAKAILCTFLYADKRFVRVAYKILKESKNNYKYIFYIFYYSFQKIKWRYLK